MALVILEHHGALQLVREGSELGLAEHALDEREDALGRGRVGVMAKMMRARPWPNWGWWGC